jgi:polysaccharide export outer membrane protein
MKNKLFILAIGAILLLQSCSSYRSNIILQTKPEDLNWQQTFEKVVVENPIKLGDKIQFSVFTNQGESIIDPSGNMVTAKNFGDANNNTVDKPTYDVLESGFCHFPLVGKVSVLGLKTSQLDSVLSAKYEQFYNGVYVLSKVVNKKIVILGGAGSKIIPYTTNMTLLEAIALYGGLDDQSKGYNIRVVRGDLKQPEVKVVNLKTIADMKQSIVNLRPDDVVYIEPIRRPGTEAFRDNLYIFNIIQVITTLSVLIYTLK